MHANKIRKPVKENLREQIEEGIIDYMPARFHVSKVREDCDGQEVFEVKFPIVMYNVASYDLSGGKLYDYLKERFPKARFRIVQPV
jgi:hypothetical protein